MVTSLAPIIRATSVCGKSPVDVVHREQLVLLADADIVYDSSGQ
jgi:hypothetical protein